MANKCVIRKTPDGNIDKVYNAVLFSRKPTQTEKAKTQLENAFGYSVEELSEDDFINKASEVYKEGTQGNYFLQDDVLYVKEGMLDNKNLKMSDFKNIPQKEFSVFEAVLQRLKENGLARNVYTDRQSMIDYLKQFGFGSLQEMVQGKKTYKLYHGTHSPIIGEYRIRNRRGDYGIYFAKNKKISRVFGDILYKNTIKAEKTLVLNDNEVAKQPFNFFNITKEQYENLIEQGYDSLVWYRKGELMEFVVLKPSIIKNVELQFLRTPQGIIYGFATPENDIYIDTEATTNLDIVDVNTTDDILTQALSEADNITLEYNEKGQHLAPNGKPSNLTEQQAKIVRTAAFKNWSNNWKDSVKDENGEPQVLYSGSPYLFTEFDRKYIGTNVGTSEGRGFYFTSNKKVADGYAEKGKVYEVFINIGKNISYENKTLNKNELKAIIKSLEDSGIDVLSNWGDVSFEGQSAVLNTATEAYFENDNDVDIVNALFNDVGQNFAVYDELIKRGYKGTEIKEADWGADFGGQKIVVAFAPNQIKLADGTNTTFNPNTNDIRYQIIGEKGAKNIEEYNILLNRAKELEKQGKTPIEISNETGWYKQTDGWKYLSKEIINEFQVSNDIDKNKILTLNEILQNGKTLFTAYPQLKDVKVVFLDSDSENIPPQFTNFRKDVYGGFIPDQNTILVNTTLADSKGGRETYKSILAHETTHLLQRIESFSNGGNLNTILDKAISILGIDVTKGVDLYTLKNLIEGLDTNGLSKNNAKIVKDSVDTINEILSGTPSETIRQNQYMHILGEIDAGIIGNIAKNKMPKLSYKELFDLYINGYSLNPNNIYVIKDDNGVQFQIIGEKGAAALDKTEEATYRMDNLQVAREMEQAGKNPKEIRLATGWEKSTIDQKWRYEILDGEVIINPTPNTNYKLKDIYKNDELFKAFPNIGDLKVVFNDKFNKNNAAYYSVQQGIDLPYINLSNEEIDGRASSELYNSMVINLENFLKENPNGNQYNSIENIRKRIEEYKNKAKNGVTKDDYEKDVKSILSHEIQHHIQHIEGFARGGNEEIGFNLKQKVQWHKINKLKQQGRSNQEIADEITGGNIEIINDAIPMITKYGVDKIKSIVKNIKTIPQLMRTPVWNVYKNLVGEVEARNVQKRINMSAEERRQTLLSETEDVAREDQIFLKNGLGVAQSANTALQQAPSLVNTAVHEFGHLWGRWAKQNRPDLYKKGLELTNDSEYLKQVQANPAYANKTLEEQQDEALMVAIGEQGDKIVNEQKKSAFKQWLSDLWAAIKEAFGITQYTPEQLSNITLEEFSRAVAIDLLKGNKFENNIKNENRYNEQERKTIESGTGFLQQITTYIGENEGKLSSEELFDKLWTEYKDKRIEEIDKRLGEEHTNGTESLIWANPSQGTVIKAMSYDMEGSLANLIDKIVVHNTIFPETSIDVDGISILSDGTKTLVAEQRYVEFDNSKTLSKQEIIDFMKEQGFEAVTDEEYPKFSNGRFEITDLHEGNIGYTKGGNIAVIDFFADINRAPSAITKDVIFQQAQEYFTRNADRLPLTLAVFQRPEFVKMQGKMVNPITVLNSLNQSGIKQIEKDLIKQIIDENYQGQKKISYDELEATVRANIMPLERIFTSSYAKYGMENLGDGNYGEANTIILNSPIEHGVTGHFSGDFKAGGRKNIKYVPKQLNDNVWVAVEEGYESQGANENNIYQFVGTAGTKEAVESWIDNYENPRQLNKENTKIVVDEGWVILLNNNNQSIVQIDRSDINDLQDIHQQAIDIAKERYSTVTPINKGMFGHIRVWQKGQDFYVAELQSDYFQKQYVVEDLTQQVINSDKHSFTKEEKDKYNSIYKDMLSYRRDYFTLRDQFKEAEISDNESLKILKEKEKNYQNKRKQYYNEVVPKAQPLFEKDEKQFIASQKSWEQRIVREAIKEAALSGATSLRFPTPYTLSVIEGYIQDENSDSSQLPYTIITKDLQNGSEYLDETGNIVELEVTDVITMGGEAYVVVGVNGTEITIKNVDNEKSIRYDNNSFREEFGEDVKIGVHSVNGVQYSYSGEGMISFLQGASERFYQPSEYVNKKAKKSWDFKISDLSDTQQTVARKYEEIANILKQERGEENVEIVTDENGFDWYETKITFQEKNNPIVAFQILQDTPIINVTNEMAKINAKSLNIDITKYFPKTEQESICKI